MSRMVRYAGREQTGPDEWRVSFDLVDGEEVTHYWFAFRTTFLGEIEVDVDNPNFWGHAAYLGGKFIENRQIFDDASGELLSPAEEAASRARDPHPMPEPAVGEVCWRY